MVDSFQTAITHIRLDLTGEVNSSGTPEILFFHLARAQWVVAYNFVWQGCVNAPQCDEVNTIVTDTPIIREKPFPFIDDDGDYKIFVPSWQNNRIGTSWSTTEMGKG